MTYDLFDPPPDPEDKWRKMRERTIKALQSYLEGPVPLHRDAHDTEILAAERMSKIKVSRRVKVALILLGCSERGITGMELCAHFPGIPEHGVRPRLTELKDCGLADLIGRRLNARDNPEKMWFPSALLISAASLLEAR